MRLHTEHQLAAFKEVPREVLGGSVEIKLKPACHVHGSLTSSELGTRGRKISWTNVYLFRNGKRHLSFSSRSQVFEFILPPGEFGSSPTELICGT